MRYYSQGGIHADFMVFEMITALSITPFPTYIIISEKINALELMSPYIREVSMSDIIPVYVYMFWGPLCLWISG